jgi:hypothetical protein
MDTLQNCIKLSTVCVLKLKMRILIFLTYILKCKNNICARGALNFRQQLIHTNLFENMDRRSNLLVLFFKSIAGLFIFILAVSTTTAYAQSDADTAKKILLASVNTKKEVYYTIKQSNVIYPDILKGNEALTSDYIASFSNNRRDYLVRMHTKGKSILPKVNTILKQYDLPEELNVLIILESAYNANAVSNAGAVGYWQFMDEVAKEYGLKYVKHLSAAEKKKLARSKSKKAKARLRAIARQKDDRKNFNKSTQAAARYLRDRGSNLDNNWLLIVASYNCGVGNVWNAMKKTGKENPDFWDIKEYLPKETQNYVMNFIALNVIYHNYDKFIANNLNFNTVKILLPDNFEQVSTEELGDADGTFR